MNFPLAANSYQGCLQEGAAGRLGPMLSSSLDSMTIQLCIAAARDQGFAYAGLQYSSNCLASNDISMYTTAGVCDMPCSGDSAQMCGAGNTNSIYRTGGAQLALLARAN